MQLHGTGLTSYLILLIQGWVQTKMGGPGAPDSLEEAPKTQVWLATSHDKKANATGKYFYCHKLHSFLQATKDNMIQAAYLARVQKYPEYPFSRWLAREHAGLGREQDMNLTGKDRARDLREAPRRDRRALMSMMPI